MDENGYIQIKIYEHKNSANKLGDVSSICN